MARSRLSCESEHRTLLHGFYLLVESNPDDCPIEKLFECRDAHEAFTCAFEKRDTLIVSYVNVEDCLSPSSF